MSTLDRADDEYDVTPCDDGLLPGEFRAAGPAKAPRRPRARAVCALGFSAKCPGCGTVATFDRHHDREYDQLYGDVITRLRSESGRIKVPVACKRCKAEYVIETIKVI